jgi:hypothetical protein
MTLYPEGKQHPSESKSGEKGVYPSEGIAKKSGQTGIDLSVPREIKERNSVGGRKKTEPNPSRNYHQYNQDHEPSWGYFLTHLGFRLVNYLSLGPRPM